MKRILFFNLIILTLLLSSCTEEKENLIIEMNVFNIHMFEGEFGHFNDTHKPKLITTYEEYLDSVSESVTTVTPKTFKEEFFVENSLILFPVISQKNPEFSMKTFDFNNGLLELEILQENSLERSIFNNTYSDNSYMLGFKINSKEIIDFNFEIFEQNNYYESNIYIVNPNVVSLESDYLIIGDYLTYINLFSDVDPIPYDGESLLDIIDETTFEDSFVFVYIDRGEYGGVYRTITDLYVYEFAGKTRLSINTTRILDGTPVSSVRHDSLLILIIDKVDIDSSELVVLFISD